MHTNSGGENALEWGAASMVLPKQRGLAKCFAQEFGSAKLFYIVFVLFGITSFAASLHFGDSVFGPATNYLFRLKYFALVSLFVMALSLAYNLYRNTRLGISKPLLQTAIGGRELVLFRVVSAIATYVLFMGFFLYWKMKITWLNPFSWDVTFADWDSALFSGKQGFDALSWLQSPAMTRNLDVAYSFWGIMCVTFWVLVAVVPRLPDQLRHRYWLATLLTWLIGGLGLATVFSSAGPAYYSLVTGDSARFATLDSYFANFDGILVSDSLKHMLWLVHNGAQDMFGGISAMPSMHNAQALLFVLVAVHMGRLYLFIAVPFLVLIFLGSIHLGWHYAVDGLFSFVLVPPIWWLAGLFVGHEEDKSAQPLSLNAASSSMINKNPASV